MDSIKREADQLFAIKKSMRDENLKQREDHDNEVWEEVDKIKEKSKEELSKIIEAGM